MRVLITGAGGFVCGNIARALLDAGHEVIALDRAFDAASREALRHERCTLIETPTETLIEADGAHIGAHIDALVHGAAITASPEDAGQTPEQNFRANLDPLLAASAWAVRYHVGRAIFISSAAVFSDTPPGPVFEDTPVTPRSVYAVAKYTLEQWVRLMGTLYHREVCAVRLSGIYGPLEIARPSRPRVTRIGQLVYEALTEGTVTVAEHEPARDWTFAPDIGRAIHALLTAPHLKHPLYHLAAEREYTPLEIARAIQAQLPTVKLRLDEQLPRMAEPFRRGYLASARLRADTGFADWTALDDGLSVTIDWQRTHWKQLVL